MYSVVLVPFLLNFLWIQGRLFSLLKSDRWKKISSAGTDFSLEQWTGKKLVGANGNPLSITGCVHASVSIRGAKFEVTFAVSSDLVVDGIIGLDFLHRHACVIDAGKKNAFASHLLTYP